MGRIRVLDDPLIDRIAAGEVVERPASVVKELVENSLDAGARSVEVLLEAGGRRAIRVTDDGEGMVPDDALLALRRHATSKLSRMEDLEGIRTLGFRGEALPSIAAVSRFVLRTARRDGEGTEIRVSGGEIEHTGTIGMPRGTSVSVERLFFNVPARRKFLRAEATELVHATRLLTRYALANPAVRFRLEQGGRRRVDAPAAADLPERAAQLYGAHAAGKLLPFEGAAAGVAVRGLAGRPADALPRRDAQHLFVNGRTVQDRMLAHAVQDAYGDSMPRGRFPSVILFVELTPGLVDVNVHPQKTEVRFRRPRETHAAVRAAVRSALSRSGVVPELSDLRPAALPGPPGRVAEAAASYLERRAPEDRGAWRSGSPPGRAGGDGGQPDSGPTADPPAGWMRDDAPAAVPLAQYRDSYIVAEDAEGLVLVDQHAAHERVLYERYLAEAEQGTVEVQRMLFPVTLELSPEQAVLIERDADELRRLGFLVEPFGGRSVRIDGVPAIAGDADPAGLLRELLGEAARVPSAAAGVGELRRRLVTTAACHAAIKIHHPLTRDGMQGLLNDLYAVASPSTCPHGRPALFRLTLDEIERAFRRR